MNDHFFSFVAYALEKAFKNPFAKSKLIKIYPVVFLYEFYGFTGSYCLWDTVDHMPSL